MIGFAQTSPGLTHDLRFFIGNHAVGFHVGTIPADACCAARRQGHCLVVEIPVSHEPAQSISSHMRARMSDACSPMPPSKITASATPKAAGYNPIYLRARSRSWISDATTAGVPGPFCKKQPRGTRYDERFLPTYEGYCADERIYVGHFSSRLNYGLSQKATEHNHPPCQSHGNRSTRNPPEQLHHGRREERLPATSSQRRIPLQMSCVVSANQKS